MATSPNPQPAMPWGAEQSRAQYAAIAWLRWRIMVNQFRRKGGAGELIARIIVIPIAASVGLGMAFAAGFTSWYLMSSNQLPKVALVLWVAFIICQFLNINLGQPGTTFDPTQLIRFPMAARNYIAIKLFFGLLTPANILVCLISFAVATGITIERPGIWLYAYAALAVFALTNILFSRMIFAWIDRWLATRRAREIFTLGIFLFSLGIQWVNLALNPAYGHRNRGNVAAARERFEHMQAFYDRIHPLLSLLPPEVTANSIGAAAHHQLANYATLVFYCGCFAVLFLAIFAFRTYSEFRGETFSDVANAVAPAAAPRSAVRLSAATLAPAGTSMEGRNVFGLTPPVATLLAKEFLAMRRNTGLFYGLIAPVFFVFIFSMRFGAHTTWPFVFPAAISYALLGIGPLAYNSFGLEGAGVQFYFMAPVHVRDIFIAKNLILFGTTLLEFSVVYVIVRNTAGTPSLEITLGTLLWAIASLLVNLIIGNRRSITAPKKIELGRTAAKQASQLSAFMSIGVLLLSGAIGGGLLLGASYFDVMWVLPPVMGILAGLAMLFYQRDLRNLEPFMYAHREEMFEELCKK